MKQQLNRLDETLVYVLKTAKKKGKDNLSKFELMKLLYLIEVNAWKFIGESFTNQINFVRDKNGPISYDVYKSTEKLQGLGILEVTEENNTEYGFPRHCHRLKKDIELNFTESEQVFLNSVLDDYLNMSIRQLKSVAYETEPMRKIQTQEKGAGVAVLKGQRLKLEDVPLDEDILEAIMN